MANFSRWHDKNVNSMREAMENIMDYENFIVPQKDPYTQEDLDFSLEKFFEENQTILIDNTNITYNVIEYHYERPRPGYENESTKSARISSVLGSIIVFNDGLNTYYIIDRAAHSTTLSFLRKINDYKGRGEIIDNPVRVNEDFFVWMINKVLNKVDESLDEDEHLKVTKIIGFKGETEDRLAEVKGWGNRIMNVLSTLAFLFEIEGVTRINPRIEYNSHTIEATLEVNGNVNIDTSTYTGDYILSHEKELLAKVVLLTYLKILPMLFDSYNRDVKNNKWSPEKKIDFFNDIGNDIQEQINEKISSVRDKEK